MTPNVNARTPRNKVKNLLKTIPIKSKQKRINELHAVINKKKDSNTLKPNIQRKTIINDLNKFKIKPKKKSKKNVNVSSENFLTDYIIYVIKKTKNRTIFLSKLFNFDSNNEYRNAIERVLNRKGRQVILNIENTNPAIAKCMLRTNPPKCHKEASFPKGALRWYDMQRKN